MKTCKEVMTSNPACALPDESIKKVAGMMQSENVGSIPIVKSREGRELIGILTDRDLVLKVVASGRNSDETKIKDVMNHDPLTCRESADIQDAVDLMALHQVRRIPVIDEEGRIVGIIAQGDVATRIDQPKTTGELVAKISE